MTRRQSLVLAALIGTGLTLVALVFLLACQQRGFDPGLCEAYGACSWRHA